jgi:hypothetical protein
LHGCEIQSLTLREEHKLKILKMKCPGKYLYLRREQYRRLLLYVLSVSTFLNICGFTSVLTSSITVISKAKAEATGNAWQIACSFVDVPHYFDSSMSAFSWVQIFSSAPCSQTLSICVHSFR